MPFEFSKLIRWGQKTAAEPSVIWRYGFAVFAVLAATGLRHAFNPVLSTQAPYMPFTFAVIVAALFGGRLPGLMATALSGLLVDWFFLKPPHSLSILGQDVFWGLALFLVLGAVIALLVGSLWESHQARASTVDTLRRQAHLIDLSHDGVITMDSHRRGIKGRRKCTAGRSGTRSARSFINCCKLPVTPRFRRSTKPCTGKADGRAN